MSRSTVDVGALSFDVREWGPQDGSPVLMLHGFPENGAAWDGVAALLPALRCIAPDQRGYSKGARPTDVDDYHVDRLVDDALGLLDVLGLPEVHLVGHDWGALVGWHLVARAPERITGFTAVSVPHPGAVAAALADGDAQRAASAYIGFFRREPDKAEHVLLRDDAAGLRGIFTGSGLTDEEIDAFVAPLQEPASLRAALCWYRAMSPDSAQLAPCPVDTMYLWGTDDVAVTAGAADRCGDFVTGPFLYQRLAQVSHWLPEQHPELVAAAVGSAVDVR